ncbi:MAG: 4-hydroxyphenylpyruvate dioxygenase [Hydrogenophaga sp.]|uniref:4-hydroxyphenylpyruvate dioxygenase n=1 Tax=Hydrogenophaga sp. TaxID=1904254 RepID=UPI001E05625E|nr:4-hydroxyphenylpyruvate dioxygenase [Hydrogenophaga sp.]MBX3609621.1 4-hydroxyphenylpyruvate dioxygenase [Hydrogenophaga sp.]
MIATDIEQDREPLQASGGDADNPLGLDGIEFVEYATLQPQALAQVLERMGFRPVARHRSREVMLYRQGGINIVVNAHPIDALGAARGGAHPVIAAVGLRVRDARAARAYVLSRGGWEVPTHPEAMELNIPAIHGVGGSRIHLIDRHREFSIYDIDFVPIPGVDLHPPSELGLRFFGLVQYIGTGRSNDWLAFYETLFDARAIPDEQRFGIMPAGHLMRMPGRQPDSAFLLQLVEPPLDAPDMQESWQRIGLGVADVLAAVRTLRERGVEFVESDTVHAGQRGAITKAYLGSVVFELVQDPLSAAGVA